MIFLACIEMIARSAKVFAIELKNKISSVLNAKIFYLSYTIIFYITNTK